MFWPSLHQEGKLGLRPFLPRSKPSSPPALTPPLPAVWTSQPAPGLLRAPRAADAPRGPAPVPSAAVDTVIPHSWDSSARLFSFPFAASPETFLGILTQSPSHTFLPLIPLHLQHSQGGGVGAGSDLGSFLLSIYSRALDGPPTPGAPHHLSTGDLCLASLLSPFLAKLPLELLPSSRLYPEVPAGENAITSSPGPPGQNAGTNLGCSLPSLPSVFRPCHIHLSIWLQCALLSPTPQPLP